MINVSSPNTPGLRLLQGKRELRRLINAATKARDALPASKSDTIDSRRRRRKPLLLKIAPDLSGMYTRVSGFRFLSESESHAAKSFEPYGSRTIYILSTTDMCVCLRFPYTCIYIYICVCVFTCMHIFCVRVDEELSDIANVCLRSRVDGIIVSNTTLSRDAVAGHAHAGEAGGLSGRPLMEPSTAVLRKMYRLTKGRIPLIGCGGVSSGQDAYEKIRAGASLVQIYTALAVQGPGVVPRIKRELAACLAADSIFRVEDAVGLDA